MDLLTEPLFLMSLAIFCGHYLGKASIARLKLGVSGTLFASMGLSRLVYGLFVAPYEPAVASATGDVPSYAVRIVQNGFVDRAYFDFFLLLFMASVGLMAAKDVSKVFNGRSVGNGLAGNTDGHDTGDGHDTSISNGARHRKRDSVSSDTGSSVISGIVGSGIKFLLLAIVITVTGAGAACLLFGLVGSLSSLTRGLDMRALTGLYAGALTSSPGLGVALESAARMFADPSSPAAHAAQASVGMGYAVAYPFSVITVITSMQVLPQLFDLGVQPDLQPDKQPDLHLDLQAGLGAHEQARPKAKAAPFYMAGIALVSLVGYLLGSVSIPLGSAGRIGLGTTGGVLVAALVLGNLDRLQMDPRALSVTKQVALHYFLAYVGLNYGHQAVAAMAGPNATLVLVGILTTITSIAAGVLFGRYVLKMDWVILSGAICGSMTSTPGLGAALEATGRNETAGAYGSTYPLGLLCKVVIVLLLSRMVM